MIHMPTSAGDAAAGHCTSPRSISPIGRFASDGQDASSMRSLVRDEVRRAIEELRGELLGGDLLCDELLSGGTGLRPALERIIAEAPAARCETALSSEVAELRASVDGAAAAATAAATAEIGRLDGAFRSSLAAEVRDLGSLAEGVRIRLEALDESAAEHIGRLSTRLAELEVRTEAGPRHGTVVPKHIAATQMVSVVPNHIPAAAQIGSSRSDWKAALCTSIEGEPSIAAAVDSFAAAGMAACNLKPEWSTCRGGLGPAASGPMLGGGAPTAVAALVTDHSSSTCSLLSTGTGMCGHSSMPAEVHSSPSQVPRETPQFAASLTAPPPSRLQPQGNTPASGSSAPAAAGSSKIASMQGSPLSTTAAPTVAAAACGMGNASSGNAPSTPPKRHVPAATAAALRSSSPGGCGASAAPPAAGSAPVSARSSKDGQKAKQFLDYREWAGTSPGRLEVRGGC